MKYRSFSRRSSHRSVLDSNVHRRIPGARKLCASGNTVQVALKSNSNGQESTNVRLDVAILSNGPGEIAAWVIPVARALKRGQKSIRISVLLAPCPHASGKEYKWLSSLAEIDRTVPPEHFWQCIMAGRKRMNAQEATAVNPSRAGLTWVDKGVVVFLGGDQASTILAGWRLKYPTLAYTYDKIRWNGFIDCYALPSVQMKSSEGFLGFKSEQVVIGDLLGSALHENTGNTDALTSSYQITEKREILLLPGSKHAKLVIMIPYLIAVAQELYQRDSTLKFLIPLAPTVTIDQFKKYCSEENYVVGKYKWIDKVQIDVGVQDSNDNLETRVKAVLKCSNNLEIEIWSGIHPPYDLYKSSTLAITTVGTNTAELAYLKVPMVVALPTFELSIFKGGSGGLLALLMKLPGILGKLVTSFVNKVILSKIKYFSLPNIWAKRNIVPEFIGEIPPKSFAQSIESILSDPKKLQKMRSELEELRSVNSSAEESLVHLILSMAKRIV